MQEAVFWAKSLSKKGNEDAMVTGNFRFVDGAMLRVDLLAHLIQENRVMDLVLNGVGISSSDLLAIFDATSRSGVITALHLKFIDFDEKALKALAMLMKRSKSIFKYHL